MFRESRKAATNVAQRKDKRTGRFRITKLEERIAPRRGYHYNDPCKNGQGKKTGNPHCGYGY